MTQTQKQATANTNFVSESNEKSANQKSSPNIKAKRIGVFAKNTNGGKQMQDKNPIKNNQQVIQESPVKTQQNQ